MDRGESGEFGKCLIRKARNPHYDGYVVALPVYLADRAELKEFLTGRAREDRSTEMLEERPRFPLTSDGSELIIYRI